MLYHLWIVLGIWSYHVISLLDDIRHMVISYHKDMATWPHDVHHCFHESTPGSPSVLTQAYTHFFQGTLGFHMVMKKCMAMSLEGRWYWTWKAHFFFFPCRSLAISVWPTDWTPATGWHAQNSHGAIVMIPFHKLKKLVEHSSRGYDEILLVQNGPHHHWHPHSFWVTIEISTLS